MIYIGSDHAGFELKKRVTQVLAAKGIPVVDMGPFKYVDTDDYPDYCIPVAKAVAKDKGSFGIVIGGSGEGEAIAANKVTGIRAAVVYDRFTAITSRQHNDANIIALRGRGVPAQKSITLLMLWLNTPFSKDARHKRRLAKIARFER